jgi:hypothetical protein
MTAKASRECQRKRTDWQSERRGQLRSVSLCLSCAQPTIPGLRVCELHLAKQRVVRAKWQEKLRERAEAEGCCIYCRSPKAPDRSMCERHLAANRESRARSREREKLGIPRRPYAVPVSIVAPPQRAAPVRPASPAPAQVAKPIKILCACGKHVPMTGSHQCWVCARKERGAA